MTGCEQQTSRDYQEFSSLTVEETDAESLSNDKPEQKSESPQANDSANDGQIFEPLVAVKPVYGQNTAELKTNIDNKTALSTETREIKLLVENPGFRQEQGASRVSYDDLDLLKVLNMEPVPTDAASHFPDWMTALDGEKVRIRGFMYPPFRETGIEFFVLARDNQICCFGRNPKVYDLISVEMREGVTTNFILNRPFDVVGTFRIRPEADGDELYGLYEITDAKVIDQ
ncbi:hypothetical protein OAE80_04435 [Planctomycetaceae bacterium]|jgi:hypothetical protein|nr:hypothetical protein [Planctomycetaceae bacterium]MDB4786656.1 hypothetical protein [Planctomycetaceae bacterium]